MIAKRSSVSYCVTVLMIVVSGCDPYGDTYDSTTYGTSGIRIVGDTLHMGVVKESGTTHRQGSSRSRVLSEVVGYVLAFPWPPPADGPYVPTSCNEYPVNPHDYDVRTTLDWMFDRAGIGTSEMAVARKLPDRHRELVAFLELGDPGRVWGSARLADGSERFVVWSNEVGHATKIYDEQFQLVHTLPHSPTMNMHWDPEKGVAVYFRSIDYYLVGEVTAVVMIHNYKANEVREVQLDEDAILACLGIEKE